MNGSNSQIIVNAQIVNLILNGNNCLVISNHRTPYLSNVILNGSGNSINTRNENFFKIANGINNKVNNHNIPNTLQNFNVFNTFQNSSFNINIPVEGLGNIMNFVQSTINSASNQMNQSSHYNVFNSNFNNFDNEDENENEEIEGEEEEDEEIERRRQELNEVERYYNEKKDRIMNLNEFQFKNINLYFKDFSTNKSLKERVGRCSICLSDFVGTDIVKQFSCEQHIFHKKCLLNWLKKSDKCPLCKESIMKGFDGINADDLQDDE